MAHSARKMNTFLLNWLAGLSLLVHSFQLLFIHSCCCSCLPSPVHERRSDSPHPVGLNESWPFSFTAQGSLNIIWSQLLSQLIHSDRTTSGSLSFGGGGAAAHTHSISGTLALCSIVQIPFALRFKPMMEPFSYTEMCSCNWFQYLLHILINFSPFACLGDHRGHKSIAGGSNYGDFFWFFFNCAPRIIKFV